MKKRPSFSFLLILIIMGGFGTAAAQPTHPDHRYMVAEHTAFNRLTGWLSPSAQGVQIKRLDVPATIEAGEEGLYAVVANVETASLPITGVWRFGDDTEKKGLSVRHTFRDPGTYEVSLRVANPRSSEARTFTVEVVDSNQAS